MKASFQWLSEYVELPAGTSVNETAKRLTHAGLEIEGIHLSGEGLAGVVVAQIRESVQHPNADKLSVTQVDAGSLGILQVVCGAKNYQVGDKVPLATVGVKLPNGVEIKRAALRGVDSFGMLCSAKELGLSAEASGLLILDPGLVPGTAITQALGLDDVTLEVNVTPNRPDALSHVGLAREVAALMGQPLKLPPATVVESGAKVEERVTIRVEDSQGCLRYVGRVIEGLTVKPSPAWLQRRLEACGVRAINNVVDVTNYVLLESGQPLHAFDLDLLGGPELVVRRARAGERLTTLDGKERTLDPEDLLICDREKPQALAGVMGGGQSEVSARTTRVLLESANFHPSVVRKTARRHGLHTEASHRFERGTDITQVAAVADRAAALLVELGGGTLRVGRVDVYPGKMPPKQVSLRFARVGEVLGVDVPPEESRRILESLGFRAMEPPGAASARFEVPGHRVDVDHEEDLIEEVARVRGYERIPAALPKGAGQLRPESKDEGVERRVRAALAGAGFDEVLNYAFVAPSELEALGARGPEVRLLNPLSVEQSVMRTSLFPGLLQNVSRSVRHQAESVRFYELGREYRQDPHGGEDRRPVAVETPKLAAVLWGSRDGRKWTGSDAAVDFYDAKGAVEAVVSALKIPGASFRPLDSLPYHPRAAAEVVDAAGRVLGRVGELHPSVTQRLDLPRGIFALELWLEALVEAALLVPEARPLPRHPAVLRDLAVLVEAQRSSEDVRRIILEVGAPLVEEASVFDVYTGKPIPEGQKNLAFAIRYRGEDRTLTDTEVSSAHEKIVAEVTRRVGGALRG